METTVTANPNASYAPYAGYGRRFGALVLDFFILVIPTGLFNYYLPVFGAALLFVLYAPVLESSAVRATIGKKLMGIQVSDEAGGRLSFGAAFLRSLTKLFSSFLCFVPYLLALFTPRRQALHDLVARSVVVYGRADIPVVDAYGENFRELLGGLRGGFGGGFGGNFGGGTPGGKDARDPLDRLERLQALYERGALTKEEFEREKAKALQD